VLHMERGMQPEALPLNSGGMQWLGVGATTSQELSLQLRTLPLVCAHRAKVPLCQLCLTGSTRNFRRAMYCTTPQRCTARRYCPLRLGWLWGSIANRIARQLSTP
jgi:hypothetical protein